MVARYAGSPSSTASSQKSDKELTAVVKGAGPSGLAAAIALAQSGFNVHVVEKRPQRPVGHGRKNMVALRPEALHQLDELGALQYALQSTSKNGDVGCITRMVAGRTTNEMDGSVFQWPLTRYLPAEHKPDQDSGSDQDKSEYQPPSKINEQVPSSFINLGDLEDCLAQAAADVGVELIYDATIHLSKVHESEHYSAAVRAEPGVETDFERPTLIVCASGKNDLSVLTDLNFHRHSCISLTASNLPRPEAATNPLGLSLPDERDLESQLYSVFGVANKSLSLGYLDHVVRKYGNGNSEPEQPVVEIQMNHASAAHFILQHPRSDPPLSSDYRKLEAYLLNRINARLETSYASIQQLKDKDVLVWGDPLTPVVVETSTAPQFVFGDNVILVGDCAMSCSPTSGLGADIGLSIDSQSIRALTRGIKEADDDHEKTKTALEQFNLSKAESAVIWSQSSRMFYLTRIEADQILEKQRGNA